jgi:hypothetical protein
LDMMFLQVIYGLELPMLSQGSAHFSLRLL